MGTENFAKVRFWLYQIPVVVAEGGPVQPGLGDAPADARSVHTQSGSTFIILTTAEQQTMEHSNELSEMKFAFG